MKKILIVNNNLDMGGIQKSLVNLLHSLVGEYDITLLLFSKSGALINDIPSGIKVIAPNSVYKILGLSKCELKKYPHLFLLKALLLKFASVFSRRSAMKLLGVFQKKIIGYDLAISYSHLPSDKYFANGCGDFVLDKIVCDNKICMIHCDYMNSGFMSHKNNSEYMEFDKIACCSESVKNRFIIASGISKEKIYTLRNFYNPEIINKSNQDPYVYNDDYLNIITVARLSVEKGIDRAIDSIYNSGRNDIKYYVVGDGPEKQKLIEKIKDYSFEDRVFLIGQQENPYRFMINADYLLVPSLHEAAPIVYDEASMLGLKIISTNTTSAKEMVLSCSGIISESFDDLVEVLKDLNKEKHNLPDSINNDIQTNQFRNLVL